MKRWSLSVLLWVKTFLCFPSFSEALAHNILLDYRETEFLHMARRLMTIASPITIMIWPLRDQNMALDGWLVKNCPFDRTDLQFYTSSATLIICQGRQETSLSPSARCRLLRNGFLNNFCLAISLMFKWLFVIDTRFFQVFQFKRRSLDKYIIRGRSNGELRCYHGERGELHGGPGQGK